MPSVVPFSTKILAEGYTVFSVHGKVVKSAFPTQTVSLGVLLEIQRLQAEMISMENDRYAVRDFRSARFFWLDNEVVDIFLPQIGPTAFAVYAYLSRFVSNETQTCWPSMATMAERLQLSKSTIHRSLQVLTEAKMLRVVEKGKQHSSSEYALLDISQSSTSGTLRVFSVPSSVPKQAIQSSATVPEQDLYNNPNKQDLILSPPSSEQKESRFAIFKEMIFKFYNWKYQRDPQWDGSEAKQLSALLKSDPKLDILTFRQWLKNYGESKDISPGERPRIFLPRLSKYSVTALNQYGRSVDVENEARDGGSDRRSRDAIAEVFGRMPGQNTAIVLAGTVRRRGGDLEKASRILSVEGN